MKTTVKVRFNASSEKFEKFGPNMYLVYLPFPEEDDAVEIMRELLSRKLGLTLSRVEFVAVEERTKNWIFDLH